ncbi:MAG TPA: hypothetical protein ACFCUY_09325 [Xenococcaceae cyanobacterium]|jgi:hypothetical protein
MNFLKQTQANWWQKVIAIVAIINLVLVFFNLSYLSLRDIYLRSLPAIVRVYDPIKGIETHPETTAYLKTLQQFEQQFKQQGLVASTTQNLIDSLQQQSEDLIVENPFLAANKLGTFAKLKRRMQYQTQTFSAQKAFKQFWSAEYLSQVPSTVVLDFLATKIEPLLKTNYYRQIDENGLYVDRFWRIDLIFMIFFGIEYLGHTFWSAKTRSDLNWGDAMLRHWYDALMLIPIWRWLRIIPVAVRLHKSGLLNIEPMMAQITHEPAAYLSQRASMFLAVRLINQSREAIQNGSAAKLLLESSSDSEVTIGEADKINGIIDRLICLTIYQVLPEVQPDVEALLRHSLKVALQESNVYQTFKKIPGFADLPQDATEQLADYLAQATYDVLIGSYTDREGKIIFDRLTNNFTQHLRQQLKNQATQTEIQVLLADLLEEWKLNYIKGSSQRDPEATLAEANLIQEKIT